MPPIPHGPFPSLDERCAELRNRSALIRGASARVVLDSRAEREQARAMIAGVRHLASLARPPEPETAHEVALARMYRAARALRARRMLRSPEPKDGRP